MCISDWSSDVCSSDLADAHLRWPPGRGYVGLAALIGIATGLIMLVADFWPELVSGTAPAAPYALNPVDAAGDRKSVVSGKRVSVSVDLGRLSITKKKRQIDRIYISKYNQ